MPYPDRVVVATTKDSDGHDFLNVFSNQETTCVVSFNGKNLVLRGKLKIAVRKGASAFGNEVVFSFLVSDQLREYNGKSPENTVEMYLPEERGIEFLQKAVEVIA